MQQAGEIVDGRRRVEAPAGTLDAHGLLVLQRLEPSQRVGALAGEAVRLAAGDLHHAAGSGDDGGIAGAAAEIAGQRVVDALLGELGGAVVGLALLEEGEERHDEAGRAEAALRAVAVDHGPLHRVQAAVLALQVLDREELAAVELAHELDAGVDGTVADRPVLEPAHGHRAGAAVALRTAFLGAGAALVQTQPVQHRHGRVDLADPPLLGAQEEPCLTHCPALRGSFSSTEAGMATAKHLPAHRASASPARREPVT